jgi:hypothetical protein
VQIFASFYIVIRNSWFSLPTMGKAYFDPQSTYWKQSFSQEYDKKMFWLYPIYYEKELSKSEICLKNQISHTSFSYSMKVIQLISSAIFFKDYFNSIYCLCHKGLTRNFILICANIFWVKAYESLKFGCFFKGKQLQ